MNQQASLIVKKEELIKAIRSTESLLECEKFLVPHLKRSLESLVEDMKKELLTVIIEINN